MELTSEESYIISQAKKANRTDPFAAKAWILTAKTLYPNNFDLQFEAYKIERAANNYEEAAKCFSYIIMTFQNQPVQLWNEVAELTAALRVPENETNPDQDFYVRMFQHVSYEVQHKILLLTANHSDNLDHCKLVLLLLKRFPQAIATHSPQLLETLVQGMSSAPGIFEEMLVQEALPLIYNKTPELPSPLVYSIFTISLKYYLNQMLDENHINKVSIHDTWKQIFQILGLCGKILSWDSFLPYNKNWSKDVYWQKLIQIVAANPPRASENNLILFYAVTLLIFSLQEYLMNTKQKIDDTEVDFILLEGIRDYPADAANKSRKPDPSLEPPKITVTFNKETPIAFATAANCLQLLNSIEQLQTKFSQLLLNLPLSPWINRFLFELAVYYGNYDQAKSLLGDIQAPNLQQNLRTISLSLIHGPLSSTGFECILKTLNELPPVKGTLIDNIATNSKERHLVLLPLTQRAILQYCTKAILYALQRKLHEPNCSNTVLGDLLVLCQLDYPKEIALAEHIFSLIQSKKQFTYLNFPEYIICIDFIEEFMHLWATRHEELNLEFVSNTPNTNTRRIGTRGADKGVKEDFKQIMKQQVARCNEDIFVLITQFITHERLHLIQNICNMSIL